MIRQQRFRNGLAPSHNEQNHASKYEAKDLLGPPYHAMPFTLREMTRDDVPAVAALHVATFNETHTVNNDGQSYELREHQSRSAFKESDGSLFGVVIENDCRELVGFAKGKPHDGGVPGFQGELHKIQNWTQNIY